MYQVVEYDRHLTEDDIVFFVLSNAPIVPAHQFGQQVDGVQVSIDGPAMPIDRTFEARKDVAAYVEERARALEHEFGFQREILPITPTTAPNMVVMVRLYHCAFNCTSRE